MKSILEYIKKTKTSEYYHDGIEPVYYKNRLVGIRITEGDVSFVLDAVEYMPLKWNDAVKTVETYDGCTLPTREQCGLIYKYQDQINEFVSSKSLDFNKIYDTNIWINEPFRSFSFKTDSFYLEGKYVSNFVRKIRPEK